MSTTTREMFDHVLEPVKGWFEDAASLTKVANLSGNVTIDPVYKGRVVHLNASGEWEMGATGHQVPCFLAQNSDDADVQQMADAKNGIYRASGDVTSGSSRGAMNAWVALGNFEIETTEYDTAQTYAYNDPVRGQASNSVSATGGVLTNAGITVYTNCICGWVSEVPFTNPDGNSVIGIWTDFVPGTAGN